MKILIIYNLLHKNNRITIDENLCSFRRYSDEKCYYLNVAYGIPDYIAEIDFDLVIFHYSIFDLVRWVESGWYTSRIRDLFKELRGYKVAITQDEYLCSDRLTEFLFNSRVKTVYTLYPESEWQKLFPREKSGLEHYFTVFAGYIDEITLKRQAKLNQRHKLRLIDLGYRARKVPYWVGRHGTVKWQLTEKFLNTQVKHNLKLDLSNNEKHVFYGGDWYKFLSRCRVVLGCESGASLHDPDGGIMRRTEQYVAEHPEASFDEVEQACFNGLDGNIQGFPVSPRNLEACMTRTCQALVEGEYGGIFKPGVHYIEIKRDWSNIAEVIKQIEDVDFCESIAENAYRDIVESGLYTYRHFVQFVLNHVKMVSRATSVSSDDTRYLKYLDLRDRFPYIFSPFGFYITHTKSIVHKLLMKLDLYDLYKRLESWIKKVRMV